MKCGVRCQTAQSDECKCECDGRNHGQFGKVEEPKTGGKPNMIVGKDGDVYVDGDWLDPAPSQAIYNHSPDGFMWGYGGSGPSQLALALLLYFQGKEYALAHYQDFKFDVIAGLPQSGFEIEDTVVNNWVEAHP